jgi:hypothetical protein
MTLNESNILKREASSGLHASIRYNLPATLKSAIAIMSPSELIA